MFGGQFLNPICQLLSKSVDTWVCAEYLLFYSHTKLIFVDPSLSDKMDTSILSIFRYRSFFKFTSIPYNTFPIAS